MVLKIKITTIVLAHTCVLNTLGYRLAVVRSGKSVLDIHAMTDVLRLLQVNPTMSAGNLRPFLVRHLPSHMSVTASYVVNFRNKALKYIAINGVQEITQSTASKLLAPSTTAEDIGTDSFINMPLKNSS